MNYRNLTMVLLLAAALMLNACNKTGDDVKPDDSGTDTPVITETEPPAPAVPVDTEDTVPAPQPPQTTAAETETEALPETTAPIPALPEPPAEETTTAPTTEETVPVETPAPAPIVIAKPMIDITDSLVPGGTPVTGQIASAESEHIRLLLDYTVEQAQDGTVILTLDVGLSCYELWCSAKTDMGTITVNGVSRTFSTDAIDHMVSEKTYIPFLTQTYNGTDSGTAAVEVSWAFNGKYGGADVGVLTAGITLRYGTDGTVAPITPETEAPAEPTVPPADPEIPEVPETAPAETTSTEPIQTEPAEPPVTEPVLPTEPDVPAETAEPTVPEVTTEPALPGNDTTPVPDTPPTEPEAPAGPAVTGIPEETVPADGQDMP